ncbi:PepSY domain-containing protein [Aeromicrobium sp.]|uniref:PepSY domain-containing protein n=1 Tax=Aeromicrobium sp. TaxID=1871063 RepID=UPI0030C1DCB1
MRMRTAAAAAGVATLLVVGGAGVALATGGDSDATVRGTQADAATKAALEATHGGTANSVERDSENGATWEVEVTRTDGKTVDVRLDENYAVVVIEGDSESS